MQGSKTEWSTLSDKIKVKRKLSRKEWIDLISRLKENHVYGCIEDMNDQKASLGIIVPKIIEKRFEERKDADPTIQATLVNDDLFMAVRNYSVRPVISYSCPKCRAKKQCHRQGVLEWGVYEWLRKNYDNKDQLWENLHVDESG